MNPRQFDGGRPCGAQLLKSSPGRIDLGQKVEAALTSRFLRIFRSSFQHTSIMSGRACPTVLHATLFGRAQKEVVCTENLI